MSWLPPEKAGLVISAVFILPFVLLSATSGQLADKYDKARGDALHQVVRDRHHGAGRPGASSASRCWLLLVCLFLMGVHSTLFGPVKYAYLPQHLDDHEITGGNGMVEMGTFVAILLGQLAGGLLVVVPGIGPELAGGACLAIAVIGRAARPRPSRPRRRTTPALKINWNPVTETLRNLKLARTDIVVFRSLLGISWMWFFGATFLSQFPSFAKDVLHGDVARRVAAAGAVLGGRGHRLAAVRGAVAPPGGDRPRAAGRHRHERVRGRPVLRGAPPGRRRPAALWDAAGLRRRRASTCGR